MKKFNEYAVVDLGSNSFHMVIARIINGAIQIIYKNKKNIHLATGLNTNNELSESSIMRGAECLALFAERLNGFPPEHVRVVATHTLRVAKNKHKFLMAAAKVFPFPIEVISGQEEARLVYLGTMTAESTSSTDTKFVIDIGGGSTEIAIGKGNDLTPLIVASRPMGCVTYTKQFFHDKKINAVSFQQAKLAAEQQIESMVNTIKNLNITVAFGTSGTIKSIYQILLDLGVSDGIITSKRLDDLISYVLEFKSFHDIDYPSLSKERKNVFVSGLAIFSGIFDALGLEALQFSPCALREGIFYELIDGPNYQDIRQNTAQSLSEHYNIDQRHAKQVVKTAKYFFSQWQQQTPITISPNIESILYWAAQLHEVGLKINFSSIHKHSSYILKNSNLPGFNEEQQLLLSTLVRYHRKSINIDAIPYFSLFEYKHIISLIQILRLSILINNQRNPEIDLQAFQLKLLKNKLTKITLEINQEFVENNKLILLDLEQEKKYWKEINDWKLSIVIS
ncbi:exopolyphosphatase [Gilliamella sp. Pra-s65]|uniref:Ppx/GppA phosphatase family protein n=1 Tax=unclassified Gilliamella TaxID=2685620 RepID=UPI001325F1F1|nr:MULTISPECIES: exopolyphosphatase [unclassified Gilliamella]MWN31088.1 exopolyphosphatase [Gilliamella sp. Pra-s60]MWN89907.1 exopolyphosphatase [Gilliamella sp. Pra-s65]MWP28347.1 exopolyphosphatase [Gilliamella sp. Pra-s54]MWP73079.1 exopolyphosphatase [Gilliamella sp. Pra-s52]